MEETSFFFAWPDWYSSAFERYTYSRFWSNISLTDDQRNKTTYERKEEIKRERKKAKKKRKGSYEERTQKKEKKRKGWKEGWKEMDEERKKERNHGKQRK